MTLSLGIGSAKNAVRRKAVRTTSDLEAQGGLAALKHPIIIYYLYLDAISGHSQRESLYTEVSGHPTRR